MDFHGQRLFKPEYAPKPFCFAVRRPDHYPEGTLTIEHLSLDSIGTSGAIHTICRRVAEPAAPEAKCRASNPLVLLPNH